jgi:tetratricopeptide (TPR) repeat protein
MQELLNLAVKAYRNGKYEHAIELLKQIVDDDKQNWLAWFYLGMANLKGGKSEEAYRIMRVVAAMCPIDQLRGTAAAVLPQVGQPVAEARQTSSKLRVVNR